MDDALVHGLKSWEVSISLVLILVLMDDALVPQLISDFMAACES